MDGGAAQRPADLYRRLRNPGRAGIDSAGREQHLALVNAIGRGVAGGVMAILLGKIVAILFHIPRREYQNIVVNVILLALAAFVAYGRFVLARSNP